MTATPCSRSLNAGDLDSLLAWYEPDATLVAAPGQLATGTDAIRAALQVLLDMKAQVKLNLTQIIVAGDIAVTYNEWTGVAKVPGADDMKFAGKAMEVCHRQAEAAGASRSTTRRRADSLSRAMGAAVILVPRSLYRLSSALLCRRPTSLTTR
jgi:uncharacterized protein (TIGR02246 family)